MAIFNAASEIIDAFMKGFELRRQKEILDLQREKLRIENQRAQVYERAQEQAVKTQQGKTRASVLDMISKGILNVPKTPVETTQPFFAPRVGIELPPQVTKEKLAAPYDFGGTLEQPITPEEVTFPTEYAKNLEMQARAKVAPQLEFRKEELQARREIALDNYYLQLYRINRNNDTLAELMKMRMQMNEDNIAARLKIAEDANRIKEKQIAASLARQGTSNESLEHRRLSKVDDIIKQVNDSPINKNYQAAMAAYQYATAIGDVRKMSGANDISLLYNWIRSQDSSAVRGDEVRLVRESISRLEQAKLAYKRIGNSIVLTPETRQAIVNDIKKQFDLKYNSVVPLIQAGYQRAKQFHPNLDQETFKKMFSHTFIFNAQDIDASRVNFDNLDLDSPIKNDMEPVVLVPKAGGK